ncbi:type I restriction endonuclease subunit R [Acutalibacter caecimuris]|uniref:type I restriction endonuclease subunit R n=1 Tax=Acutalibacter caecimuris TaxID=3093657 RepID=UPI002AC909B6|nr:type I restriction endonuclease subunit R [Acutalibacter sp. M00118]
MGTYNLIASSNKDTVVTEYEPVKARSDSYQSEAALEKEFIRLLCEQGYEYLPIHAEKELVANLRKKLEELNGYTFADSEWERFFSECISGANDGIEDKTRRIQEDFVQVLRRDTGESKNISLIDKKNIHNNRLQVINQYTVGKADSAHYDNRYDVTVLVNGLPLVHIELKRRGVAIREAFNQIDRYQRDSFWAGSGLYDYVQIFVISNGTNTKYYSNTTRRNAIKDATSSSAARKKKTSNSFEFTSFWADANNRVLPDLIDFTRTFFAKHTLLNVLTRYCIFTSEQMLMVMRPYQITATERILNRIEIANNYKKYGSIAGGGYIWHTTGSGKTLTSFKTARLAFLLPYIGKVLFVVDRKDLDYQTMKEYDRFEKGAANSNTSTAILKKQLEDPNARIIITTIQKLSTFVAKNKGHEVYDKRVVIIFDECHRSQFGDMHTAIVKNFKKYHLFGFTGTPIFAVNAGRGGNPQFRTTQQTFGDQLHTYTIVDAINDKNVLPFHVDYYKTMGMDEEMIDEQVWDINREKAYMAPERIELVTRYILEHFDQKTYRGNKTYMFNALTNISEVAAGKSQVEEIKKKQRLSGFNSIFAVASVDMAKLYYAEFKRQMDADPSKRLRVAIIYSYGANEVETDGILDEENPEDTSALDQNSRDFLEQAIRDYNGIFHTNYDTSGDKFQNYYKDVSLRMKNREIDLLIVVNMFLTGFDATTLNTLWVDKNLKMHGLIQAFSRTNRILNSVKTFGNIVCFRNLQKRVDDAISLFGDKQAGGIVLLRSFQDYFSGYTDEDGVRHPGYETLIQKLLTKFPLSEPQIIGEQNEKDFISVFGAILRMRNILTSFDQFQGCDILSERDLQDYLGRYQDLKDEWAERRKKGTSSDIDDDIVFEIELIRQVEINIDYILLLVKKYHDSHSEDKEILITIRKAVDASPELRSKKALIENFIAGINDVEDVFLEWREFVMQQKEQELTAIITEERLKPEETRQFMESSLQAGEIKTTGTDIDRLMPPVSRFGGGNRAEKKQRIIDRFKGFFDKYFGLGTAGITGL